MCRGANTKGGPKRGREGSDAGAGGGEDQGEGEGAKRKIVQRKRAKLTVATLRVGCNARAA
jgi:hypothetical protein